MYCEVFKNPHFGKCFKNVEIVSKQAPSDGTTCSPMRLTSTMQGHRDLLQILLCSVLPLLPLPVHSPPIITL